MNYLKIIGIAIGVWLLYIFVMLLINDGFRAIIDWLTEEAPALFVLIILAFVGLCVYIISQWF